MIEDTLSLYSVVTTERLICNIRVFVTDAKNGTIMLDPRGLVGLPPGRYAAKGQLVVEGLTYVFNIETTIGDT